MPTELKPGWVYERFGAQGAVRHLQWMEYREKRESEYRWKQRRVVCFQVISGAVVWFLTLLLVTATQPLFWK